MLVSIIVPVYNTEKYISACLESIVNQTYKEIEIILVDDGSTDGSVGISEDYAKKDPRIVIIQGGHQGVVHARKTGVKSARGEYCMFVDSDDWIAENLLEVLVPETDNGNTDVVNYNMRSVKEGKITDWNYTIPEGVYEYQQLDRIYEKMMFDFEYGVPGIIQSLCTKLIKRNLLLESIGLVDNRITMGEDAAVVYSAMLKAKKIVINNSYLYFYRVRSGSMCTSKDPEIFSKILFFQQYMQDVFSGFDNEYRLEDQLQAYVFSFLKKGIWDLYSVKIKKLYRMPFFNWNTRKKIVLYGAGEVGKSYYRQLRKEPLAEVTAWVDKGKAKQVIYNCMIGALEALKNIKCDKVLIAVLHENQAQEIRKQLREYFEDEQIMWIKPISYWWENEIDI